MVSGAGISITLAGDQLTCKQLTCKGPAAQINELVPKLREHKADLILMLRTSGQSAARHRTVRDNSSQ